MKVLIVTDKYTPSKDISNGIRIGKAFRLLGHEVTFMEPEVAAVGAKEADFILAIGSLLYKHRLHLTEGISRNKKPEAKFAIWIFDSCSEIDVPSRTLNTKIKEILPHIDLLVTTDHSYPWEKYASDYLHLFQGIDLEDFVYKSSNNATRPYDVIFVGGLHDRYPERVKILKRIGREFDTVIHSFINVDKLAGLPKVTLKNKVYGQAFFNAHQQAKIAFVPRPPSMVKADYWSNRIYMATVTSTCCLVEYVKGMEEEFEDMRDVLFSHNNEDTIKKIQWLLARPKIRTKLGRNARLKTLKNYKYIDRVQNLLEAL